MKRLFFPIILFMILVFEGVAIELLPASLSSSGLLITPHWVFIFLLLITLLYDRADTYFAIYFGIAFGLLIDIVYTNLLGVYMFVYPFTLYIVHLLKRFLQTNLYMVIAIAVLSLFILEILLLVIYSIVGIAEVPQGFFITRRFIPTVLANVLFLIPVYYLFAHRLIRWGKEQLEN